MSDITTLLFYYDNEPGNPPLEYRGIEIELNFEDLNQVQASISATQFTFVNEIADKLNAYKEAGVNGGPGVMYGYPFRIELDGEVLFNGYIDLADSDTEFSCAKVVAKIREAEHLDWIEKVADGFGLDLLYSLTSGNGRITEADFVKIARIRSAVPDYQELALYFIYAFVIEQTIEDIIKDIAFVSADIAGFFTTAAGIVKLIFLAAKIILTVIAIIALLKKLVELLLSDVRYYNGMMYLTMLEKGCQYLGYTFKSSLFQNIPTNITDINGAVIPPALWANQFHLPKKTGKGFKKKEKSNNAGYYEGTFGDLIREVCAMFNSKVIITGKILRIERVDYGSSTEIYQIPNVRRDSHGINANEIVSNYLIQFQIDNLDLNTINRYAGTNSKNYITPKVIDESKSSLITGSKTPPITTALGKRKNDLTEIENLLKKILETFDKLLAPIYKAYQAIMKAVNKAVSFINKIIKAINTLPGVNIPKVKQPNSSLKKPDFSAIIENRIGMLSLSSDFVGVHKSFLITGSGWDVKITTDNETKLSAENLWNKYHFIESMVPSKGKPAANQKYIYSIPKIPFCLHDYKKVRGLLNENEGPAKVLSPEGNKVKTLSIKWNVWNNTAYIKYAEEKLYTTNLKQVLLKNT